MRKLLAVGVVGPWEGDWHCVRGDERGVVTSPRGEGESVQLEVEIEGRDTTLVTPLPAGLTILQIEGWRRYRVVKTCGAVGAQLPTNVELVTHGASPASGRSDDPKRADTQ